MSPRTWPTPLQSTGLTFGTIAVGDDALEDFEAAGRSTPGGSDCRRTNVVAAYDHRAEASGAPRWTGSAGLHPGGYRWGVPPEFSTPRFPPRAGNSGGTRHRAEGCPDPAVDEQPSPSQPCGSR